MNNQKMNLDEIRQKLCFLLVKIRMVDYGGNIVEHHRSLEVLCRNLSLITTPADVKKEECADLLKQCIDLFNSKSNVKCKCVFFFSICKACVSTDARSAWDLLAPTKF